MKKIRYGIIGFGRFAERAIAPAIKSSENSELIALQKRSSTEARKKAATYGVPYAFDSVEELVRCNDVDAVFIVSANSAHCAETIAAANAGKHVLVEKPMATSVAEAESMIEACYRNNVKLMVGTMVRLSPLIERMKSLINAGTIGRVTAIRSEFFYDARQSHRRWLLDPNIAGGGPIFDVGVHSLDTMRYLLDDEVLKVHAVRSLQASASTESTAFLAMKFVRGTPGSIYCSYETSFRRSFIEVVGNGGTLSAKNFTRSGVTATLRASFGKNDEVVDSWSQEIPVPDLYAKETTLFSDAIVHNRPNPLSGENGLANQRVLNAAIA
jgi:1,5-anhydro-D-fructose reductase (1,5-anhydro-D-mannitol-forming)